MINVLQEQNNSSTYFKIVSKLQKNNRESIRENVTTKLGASH